MKRLKLFSLILVILMTWTTSIFAAPLTLGDISILPKVIPVNYDTLITVTIRISDPTYIGPSQLNEQTPPRYCCSKLLHNQLG